MVLCPDLSKDSLFSDFEYTKNLIDKIYTDEYIFLFSGDLPIIQHWTLQPYYESTMKSVHAVYFSSICELLFLQHCTSIITDAILQPTQAKISLAEIKDVHLCGLCANFASLRCSRCQKAYYCSKD